MFAKPQITRHALNNAAAPNRPWRCRKCYKLLGTCSDGVVEVTFARGHRYLCSTPVTAICRSCGELNQIRRTN